MSSGVAWKLSGIHRSGWGWEVHSTSQERWMKMFWRVILCLSVMAPRGDTRSQISVFWRGCRLSSVSGSRRVLSQWLFYMQASVSWIRYRFKSIDLAPVTKKKKKIPNPYCTFTMSSLLWPTNIRCVTLLPFRNPTHTVFGQQYGREVCDFGCSHWMMHS